MLNRDFESALSWTAHNDGRVTHMAVCKGILITIGVSSYPRLMNIATITHISGRGSIFSSVTENMGLGKARERITVPPFTPVGEDTAWDTASSCMCDYLKSDCILICFGVPGLYHRSLRVAITFGRRLGRWNCINVPST